MRDEPSTTSTESLATVLAARARTATDGRLVVDVVLGLGIAVGAAYWHHKPWLLPFTLGTGLAMFGIWGIVDRELATRHGLDAQPTTALLRLVRSAAVLVGLLALILGAFALISISLGTWIS